MPEREIKFRGWHTTQKKMFSAETMASDQLTLLPTGEFINVNGRSTSLSVIYPKDKFIPLQYTGLKDKHGKEIYEADRLKQGAFTRTVRYNIGKGAWYAGELRLTQTLASQMEIRDNIYENKHLEGDYV